MIPWVREKFAERRARWAASKRKNEATAEGGNASANINSDGEPQPTTTCTANNENCSNLVTNDRVGSGSTSTFPKSISGPSKSAMKDASAKEKIKIRVISPTGRMVTISAEIGKRIVDVKNKALMEFSGDSESLPYCVSNINVLSRRYRLIRSDLSGAGLNEELTLSQAGIYENDTLVLAMKREPAALDQTQSTTLANRSRPPTADDIEMATSHVPQGQRTNFVDVTDVLPESSYHIRQLFIALANTSARIIGAGPYAQRLIYVLSQKIKDKKKNAKETLESLVDIGFKEDLADYALKIHNNNYAAALEWLIQHQNDSAPQCIDAPDVLSPTGSTSTATSAPNPITIVENTKALLKIVKVYSHRTIQPNPEAVQSLVDMGFVEQDAERALRKTHNDQSAACDYLCGIRGDSMFSIAEATMQESPILQSILELPHVQMGLSNPKMFLSILAFLSSNVHKTGHSDSDTNMIITNIIHKYHEEKHVLGTNQLHSGL